MTSAVIGEASREYFAFPDDLKYLTRITIMTKRRPNLRRLLNSWSARALALVAGIAASWELVPSLRTDLPGWVPGLVAACALLSRILSEPRK